MKPTHKSRNLNQLYTTGTVLLLSAQLLSCSKSTALSQSSTTVTDLSSGITKLNSVISKSAPQVKPAALITWAPIQKMKRYWKDFSLFPKAVAGGGATLGSIWGEPSVAPSVNPTPAGVVSLVNQFFGGSSTGISYTGGNPTFTCSGAPYCADGTYNVNETLIDYVGQELSSSFHNTNGASNTLFGRLSGALSVPCVMGKLIPNMDTDGLPSIGVQTFTLPADTTNIVYQPQSEGGCGMDTGGAGRTLSATISAVNGSRYYTKSMSINVGNPIMVYMKLDLANGVFNMMSVEDQRGSGRYAVDRSIINMTGMNTSGASTVALEYISTGSDCLGSPDGGTPTACGSSISNEFTPVSMPTHPTASWGVDFEFHRIFIDQANDVGYLLSTDGSPGDSSGSVLGHQMNNVIFTAAGKPNEIAACSSGSCAQNIAMSFSFVGQHDGAGTTTLGEAAGAANATDFNGCVNVGSIAVAVDDVTTCGSLTVNSAVSAATALNSIRSHYSLDAVADLLNTSDGSYGLAFSSGSDIYTAAY